MLCIFNLFTCYKQNIFQFYNHFYCPCLNTYVSRFCFFVIKFQPRDYLKSECHELRLLQHIKQYIFATLSSRGEQNSCILKKCAKFHINLTRPTVYLCMSTGRMFCLYLRLLSLPCSDASRRLK